MHVKIIYIHKNVPVAAGSAGIDKLTIGYMWSEAITTFSTG